MISVKCLFPSDQISFLTLKSNPKDMAWNSRFHVRPSETLIFLGLLFLTCIDSSNMCPSLCECGTQSGSKYTDCHDVDFTTLPNDIPIDTKSLFLTNTKITSFSANAFSRLSHLLKIELSQNRIENITDGVFNGLTNLKTLNLPNNGIRRISSNAFSGLTTLTKLTLSSNELTSLPKDMLKDQANLRTLSLDNNQLRTLPSGFLNSTVSLISLHLNKNQIQSIEDKAFEPAGTTLLMVNLENNRLPSLPRALYDIKRAFIIEIGLGSNLITLIQQEAEPFFEQVKKSHGKITLSGNPLVCTSGLQWLQTWIKQNQQAIKDLDQVMCATLDGKTTKLIDYDFNSTALPGTTTAPTTSPTTMIQTTTILPRATDVITRISQNVTSTQEMPVHPEPPSNLEVVETRAWEVLLRWTPGFSGRAPITMYKIEYDNDSFYEPITAKWKTGLTVRDAHKVYQLFPLVVPHLRPHTEYRFRVIAINRVGPSPPSNVSQSVTTLEAAPSLPPSDLKVHSREHADELEISWKIPPRASWNSAFIGYKIEFEPSSSSEHILKITVPYSQQTRYIVGGLLRYTRYKISIKTYNLNGKGASNTTDVFYTTAEGAPTVPPSNVRTKVVSSTEIEVSWGPVPEVGRNGKILGYKISYRVADKTIENITEIKSSETYSIKISGLESFVVYEFEILAYTRYGPGPRSRVVRAKTLESAPTTTILPSTLRLQTTTTQSTTTTSKLFSDSLTNTSRVISTTEALTRATDVITRISQNVTSTQEMPDEADMTNLERNKHIILATCLSAAFIALVVFVAMYCFRSKIVKRDKVLSTRYDRVRIV